MDSRLRSGSWRARRVLRKPVVARRHRRLGDDDVAVASYPRSGSNWFVMMLGELLIGEEVEFLTRPFPVIWIADYTSGPRVLPGGGRAVKTHEPYHPTYKRAIYVVRHPANVALSYHHGRVELGMPDLDLEAFLRAWATGEIGVYPTWDRQVESWLDAPSPVLVLKFEDLLADTRGWMTQAVRFLGLERSPVEIETAVANNSIDRMRAKAYRARALVRGGERAMEMQGGGRNRASELRDAEFELLCSLLSRHFGPTMARLGYGLPDREPVLV